MTVHPGAWGFRVQTLIMLIDLPSDPETLTLEEPELFLRRGAIALHLRKRQRALLRIAREPPARCGEEGRQSQQTCLQAIFT